MLAYATAAEPVDRSGAWAVRSRGSPRATRIPQRAELRRPRRIKFNLIVWADCEPTSVSGAVAINRHVDRMLEGVSA
jgi:hypothetical protein